MSILGRIRESTVKMNFTGSVSQFLSMQGIQKTILRTAKNRPIGWYFGDEIKNPKINQLVYKSLHEIVWEIREPKEDKNICFIF